MSLRYVTWSIFHLLPSLSHDFSWYLIWDCAYLEANVAYQFCCDTNSSPWPPGRQAGILVTDKVIIPPPQSPSLNKCTFHELYCTLWSHHYPPLQTSKNNAIHMNGQLSTTARNTQQQHYSTIVIGFLYMPINTFKYISRIIAMPWRVPRAIADAVFGYLPFCQGDVIIYVIKRFVAAILGEQSSLASSQCQKLYHF